ncbi:hypothetical protein [Ancylobacter oerskovii]|uniref:YARHG domain-containing protein n=1 Tax=Ancylobacter oerskovii TaxID=459519 RepID=A0ABW4YXT8_9HYPH|nr:hypothetical protein [Ancylobacter oerskovii]MBS7542066.1 hypothetical protein [Ancylobacter oerskovii]
MRVLLLCLPLVMAAAPAALAQAMPNSLQMTCTQVADLVKRQGAVVIGTGPNLFDRYVANQGYCDNQSVTTPAWLATSDNPQCFIGYRCRNRYLHGR